MFDIVAASVKALFYFLVSFAGVLVFATLLGILAVWIASGYLYSIRYGIWENDPTRTFDTTTHYVYEK